MKRIAFSLFYVAGFATCAFAQWTGTSTNDVTTRTGNVVMGTTASPNLEGSFGTGAKILQMKGESTWLSMISSLNGGASFNLAYASGLYTGFYSRNAPMLFYTSPTPTGGLGERLRITTDGNVGIGTNAPQSKLDVAGDIRWGTSMLRIDQGGSIEIKGTGLPYIDLSNDAATDYDARIILQDNDVLRIAGASVGIGTPDPGSFKLAVEGKIGAREVHVTVENPWPDYIFDPSYQLMPLADVSDFISKNKHLPGVPSADEIAKQGHKLGEMDVVLLKKVEELTLYIIELQKEIEKMKSREDVKQTQH